MPYTRTMGSDHPGLFIFLLDCSASMRSTWPGNTSSANVKKAQFLSDMVNKVIREIGANASGKPRCDIALVGYEGGEGAFSLWSGPLLGRGAVSITEIVQSPKGQITRKEQRNDPFEGITEVEAKYDYWLEPETGGNTPMGQGLRYSRELIETWLLQEGHDDSFPPIVIHVTDGVPNADEKQLAQDEARKIRSLRTSDGNVLLFTIHIPDKSGKEVLFPVTENDLPTGDNSAQLLFEMSSVLPDEMLGNALEAGLQVSDGCRLMVLNADAMATSKLITWGSSSGGANRLKPSTINDFIDGIK